MHADTGASSNLALLYRRPYCRAIGRSRPRSSMARAPPCQGGKCRFESGRGRNASLVLVATPHLAKVESPVRFRRDARGV